MEGLSIVLDATTNALPNLPTDRSEVGQVSAIGGIPAGMASGKASVMVTMLLPDGRTVAGETSLALLISATRALAARYEQ